MTEKITVAGLEIEGIDLDPDDLVTEVVVVVRFNAPDPEGTGKKFGFMVGSTTETDPTIAVGLLHRAIVQQETQDRRMFDGTD